MFCIDRMNFCSWRIWWNSLPDLVRTFALQRSKMAMITRWRWWWLGCWCSCSLRAGLGPGTGLRFCLWLSFTQIAESCLWEPKIWSPGIPGGIFGRTAQLSSLICGWGGFWVGPLAFVGYRAVPWGAWVLALWSLSALPILICHPLFKIAKNIYMILLLFCLLIGDNLLSTCWMTILLLLSPELEIICQ